mgnify:CR=1 FL=1
MIKSLATSCNNVSFYNTSLIAFYRLYILSLKNKICAHEWLSVIYILHITRFTLPSSLDRLSFPSRKGYLVNFVFSFTNPVVLRIVQIKSSAVIMTVSIQNNQIASWNSGCIFTSCLSTLWNECFLNIVKCKGKSAMKHILILIAKTRNDHSMTNMFSRSLCPITCVTSYTGFMFKLNSVVK